MAMAFSVAGLRTPGVTLDDAGCVKKTFPTLHSALDDVVRSFASPAEPSGATGRTR
ncbi:hypothetical protein [Promicromonospora sp. NPDC060271]|uniref:hypothetical protein n=1 Tax=Promicromonospora sp. NPDC060271 TaxID=3347089 RepID=UPI00364AA9A2